jgi:hypothetical protein
VIHLLQQPGSYRSADLRHLVASTLLDDGQCQFHCLPPNFHPISGQLGLRYATVTAVPPTEKNSTRG